MKRASWIAAGALTCIMPAPARAENQELVAWLHVERTDSALDCPDARGMAARVNEIAGRDAIAERDVAGLGVAVRIDRTEEGYAAFIHIYGGRAGERSLSDPGPTCEGLADAVAVTLALLLDEGAAPVDSPQPDAQAPLPPASEPTPAPIGQPEFRRAPGPQEPSPIWTVDAGAMQTAGVLDGAVPTVHLGTDYVVAEPFSVGAGMLWLPSDTVTFGGGEVDLSLVAWFVQGCVGFLRGRTPIGLSACIFPAAGVLTGEGTGYVVDRRATQSWVAGGASLVADGRIVGPVGFSARLAGVAPLSRDFIVETEGGGEAAEGAGVAFETSPVGVLAGVAIRATIF